MLELFLECMPEYNIDRPDGEGKPKKFQRINLPDADSGFMLISKAILRCCWRTLKATATCAEPW